MSNKLTKSKKNQIIYKNALTHKSNLRVNPTLINCTNKVYKFEWGLRGFIGH